MLIESMYNILLANIVERTNLELIALGWETPSLRDLVSINSFALLILPWLLAVISLIYIKKCIPSATILLICVVLSSTLNLIMPWLSAYQDIGAAKNCNRNLIRIASTLEEYSTEHAGRYPSSLKELALSHRILTIPTCPAVHIDTYSSCYQVYNTHPAERYTVYCKGINHIHAGIPPDRPIRFSE